MTEQRELTAAEADALRARHGITASRLPLTGHVRDWQATVGHYLATRPTYAEAVQAVCEAAGLDMTVTEDARLPAGWCDGLRSLAEHVGAREDCSMLDGIREAYDTKCIDLDNALDAYERRALNEQVLIEERDDWKSRFYQERAAMYQQSDARAAQAWDDDPVLGPWLRTGADPECVELARWWLAGQNKCNWRELCRVFGGTFEKALHGDGDETITMTLRGECVVYPGESPMEHVMGGLFAKWFATEEGKAAQKFVAQYG